MKIMDIAVIGAGASGMAAAVTALEAGRKVILYEADETAGRKILATGNGRCNFTNELLSEDAYHTDGPLILRTILQKYTAEDIRSWFEKHGMLSKSRNGYCYPFSDQASTVREILLSAIEQYHGKIICSTPIREIRCQNGLFLIGRGQEQTAFHHCILACGSEAGGFMRIPGLSPYLCASQFGLSCTDRLPALTRCSCHENDFKILSGVRADARLTVSVDGKDLAGDRGEVQFTSQGLSGIVFFQLSGIVSEKISQGYHVQIHVDLCPDFSLLQLSGLLETRLAGIAGKSVETFFLGMWNQKITAALCRRAGLELKKQAADYSPAQLKSVLTYAKDCIFTVSQMASMKEAQVCRGGISLSEVNASLESLKYPGLFLCGELLNVDGICGGYNLHWAWASGITAGLGASTGFPEKNSIPENRNLQK